MKKILHITVTLLIEINVECRANSDIHHNRNRSRKFNSNNVGNTEKQVNTDKSGHKINP